MVCIVAFDYSVHCIWYVAERCCHAVRRIGTGEGTPGSALLQQQQYSRSIHLLAAFQMPQVNTWTIFYLLCT